MEINEAQVWRQNIYIYVIYIKERSVRGGGVENKTGLINEKPVWPKSFFEESILSRMSAEELLIMCQQTSPHLLSAALPTKFL